MKGIENRFDYKPYRLQQIHRIPDDNTRIINLVSNDFSNLEIHSQVGLSITALGSRISTLCHRLNLNDRLQLALFWVRVGKFEIAGLQYKVHLSGYGLLDAQEKQVLDALVGNMGRTNDQMYSTLGMKQGTMLERLLKINRQIGIGSGASRVGLAVGYELYLASHN